MTPQVSDDRLERSIDAAEAEWLERFTAGPSRTRWDSPPVQVGDKAPDITLLDHDGEEHQLSDHWSEDPALVIFWRHFGCSCGFDRAERLDAELDQYRAAGAKVVIVGQGEPERAAAYRSARRVRPPILCDPDFHAYRAYGLLQGSVPQVLYDAPEEYWDHDHDVGVRFARQRRDAGRPMADDPWQLPGEFVVDTSGTIRLAYRYQYCEDFPDPLVLLTAIRRP